MESLIKYAIDILCSHCRRFENCYVFQDDLAILKEVSYVLRERLRSIHYRLSRLKKRLLVFYSRRTTFRKSTYFNIYYKISLQMY